MPSRRRVLAALPVLATGLAGCQGTVDGPATLAVENPRSDVTVSDLAGWTSGTGTEFRSAVVVTATVGHRGTGSWTAPPVSVRFEPASGETVTLDATYETRLGRFAIDERADNELGADETVGVRAVYDPDGPRSVERATVIVRPDDGTPSR